jgi:hypothetical protein
LLIKLFLDSQEIELEAGWEAVESLIDHLPGDDPALAEAFATLGRCSASTIRRSIASKESIPEETIAALADDPAPEVILALANHQRRKIGEAALREIIGRNWSCLNREIATYVEDYDQADVTQIAKLLAGSTDPTVRAALAGNSSAPKVIIKQLLNDPDAEVRRLARVTLIGR